MVTSGAANFSALGAPRQSPNRPESTLLPQDALFAAGLPCRPCGLNADWSVSAWHLSPGAPNLNPGDIYLLDNESAKETFHVARRLYPESLDPEDYARRKGLEKAGHVLIEDAANDEGPCRG